MINKIIFFRKLRKLVRYEFDNIDAKDAKELYN